MKKILAVLFALLSLAGCQTPNKEANKEIGTVNQSGFKNIDASTFRQLANSENGIIVDVRTAPEYSQGHIPNAISIDIYQRDFEQKIQQLPKDKEIYVYCTVGARSSQAAQILLANGFTKVYNLDGGIMDWANKGFEIE